MRNAGLQLWNITAKVHGHWPMGSSPILSANDSAAKQLSAPIEFK